MLFGGRMKRQLKMAEITDPLVNNAKIMIEEILGKLFSNENSDSDEVLLFSMWMVFTAFSTEKPNPTKKEGGAIRDAYAQMFSSIGADRFDGEISSSNNAYLQYNHEYTNKYLALLQIRGEEYNDAFNKDKANAFMTPDNDFEGFFPTNIVRLLVANCCGRNLGEDEMETFGDDFQVGFRDFMGATMSEVTTKFEGFRL
jgi:hypothetical protein